jgi:long-chain acyl-CoA synthetase
VPASLRRVTVGSAAMSAAELLALRALFPDAELYFTYGQTELGPRVSTLHVDAQTLSRRTGPSRWAGRCVGWPCA